MAFRTGLRETIPRCEADGLWLTCAFVCLAGFNGAYRPIPGFAMWSGATVIKQATKMQCEKKCTSEKNCRSFSYRMSDRTCIWSLSSLSFDPDFMFAVKSSNPNARSKFREFDGMVYRTQGWTIVGGVSPARCRAMCQAHKLCKAYSARGRDKLCLMGPKGVAYSEDFTYYEKRGIPYAAFPLLPPGAKFSCTGPMCPKQPKPVDDPTRDPVLGAMEQAAKSAKKTASADEAKALAVKAETAATIVAEKLKTAEEIDKTAARAKIHAQFYKSESAAQKAKVVQESERPVLQTHGRGVETSSPLTSTIPDLLHHEPRREFLTVAPRLHNTTQLKNDTRHQVSFHIL